MTNISSHIAVGGASATADTCAQGQKSASADVLAAQRSLKAAASRRLGPSLPHLDQQDIARRALEIALFVVIAAALTGAWLAFFTFVPFDLRVR